MIHWISYWRSQHHENEAQLKIDYSSKLVDSTVTVLFDEIGEYYPCLDKSETLHAKAASDQKAAMNTNAVNYVCFKHLRLRVKDLRSVPGWSLTVNDSESDDMTYTLKNSHDEEL